MFAASACGRSRKSEQPTERVRGGAVSPAAARQVSVGRVRTRQTRFSFTAGASMAIRACSSGHRLRAAADFNRSPGLWSPGERLRVQPGQVSVQFKRRIRYRQSTAGMAIAPIAPQQFLSRRRSGAGVVELGRAPRRPADVDACSVDRRGAACISVRLRSVGGMNSGAPTSPKSIGAARPLRRMAELTTERSSDHARCRLGSRTDDQ